MHTHRCVQCGLTWDCVHPRWRKRSVARCEVTNAAKVNGDGPYCTPCLEAEMQRRVAFVDAWNRVSSRVGSAAVWKPYLDAARALGKEPS
jgi:hypothetical protein